MKSTLRLMLCLLVCLLLAVPALAAVEGCYDYYIDSMIGGAVLTGYSGSETDVIVPDMLGGYPVMRLSYGAFHDNSSIVSVTLPDSLQYMDGGAFYECSSLTAVYLPENLIEFSNSYAYAHESFYFYVDADSATAQLMEATPSYPVCFIDPQYPDHLISIKGGAICYAGYIGKNPNMVIPPVCTVVNSDLFSNTPNKNNIFSVTISEGVTRIEDNAFGGGWNFSLLSLPSTLRYIGSRAFFATGVRTMIIPEGVTEVGEVVTDSALHKLVLPASLTTIPKNAFARNSSNSTNVGTIYCYQNTPAAEWAKARPYQKIKYLDDTGYSFVFPERPSSSHPEEPHAYIGSGYDWRTNMLIFPSEPDIPYTLHIASDNPKIASVQNDELVLHTPGKVKLTVTSPELGISGSFNLTVYATLEDFSIPEYVFTKVGTTKLTISASGQIPAAGTDPVFNWQLHRQNSGYGSTGTVFKLDRETLPALPEVCSIAASPRNSTLTRSGKLVVYSNVDSAVFDPFTGTMGAGMTVEPEITVTVDGTPYEKIAATYTLASSNVKIAKPTADGKLELLTPGTATITAKFLDGKTAKQTITVVGEKIYTLARGVKVIERETYLNCPVTIMIVPEGYEVIGERAFAGCADMHRIELPASVTLIAEDAFDGCSPELTVAAPAGSYAESYAAAHGFAVKHE